MATLQLSVAVAVVSLHFGGVSEHGNEIFGKYLFILAQCQCRFSFYGIIINVKYIITMWSLLFWPVIITNGLYVRF